MPLWPQPAEGGAAGETGKTSEAFALLESSRQAVQRRLGPFRSTAFGPTVGYAATLFPGAGKSATRISAGRVGQAWGGQDSDMLSIGILAKKKIHLADLSSDSADMAIPVGSWPSGI